MSQKLPVDGFKWVENTFELNNVLFRKTMENMRKQRYQACNTGSKKELFGIRTKLSHIFFFSENLLVIEMDETQMLMNKPIY